MPFDNELMFFDNSTTFTSGAPTSTTASSGHRVLDLKETGAKGLVALFIVTAQGSMADGDYFAATIQACDTEDFSTGEVERLASIGGATSNELLYGSETPCVVMRRFATTKRYVRCYATLSAGGTAPTGVWILLAAHPFDRL